LVRGNEAILAPNDPEMSEGSSPPAGHGLPATAASREVLAGIGLMILFTLVAPVTDIIAKIATQTIPPAQVSIARYVAQLVALMPLVLWHGDLRNMTWRILGLHALRGASVAASTIAFFAAIREMPVADAIAIFFVGPMMVTVLGGLLLGERVGWRRYLASAVGFGGALIVVRPSFQELGFVALLPLLTAFTFTIYLLLTRYMSKEQSVNSLQAMAGLFGTLIISAVLWIGEGTGSVTFDPIWPDMHGWVLLVSVGLLTTLSHMFLVHAFARAPASLLAPLQYLEIVAATAFGYLVFGDFPDATKWVGITIIVASGLFIIWRERAKAA
jgi:S-adenosylmethionine uptake transporter